MELVAVERLDFRRSGRKSKGVRFLSPPAKWVEEGENWVALEGWLLWGFGGSRLAVMDEENGFGRFVVSLYFASVP